MRQGSSCSILGSVQNIVRKYVGAAGKTEAISLHLIRHTVGTNIALNETPLLIFRRAEEFTARTHQHNTLLVCGASGRM